jgi:hypothetical protein
MRLYERPDTITATNRGDIAATLVHIYSGGTSVELEQALEAYVGQAADNLPRFDGAVALVLDASASTRGYGSREFCVIAQSVALARVLKRNCTQLRIHRVGGSGAELLPVPGGATDLAGALLDALEGRPDLVAIVSDGYENVYGGDLARVVATLPRLDAAASLPPVVFCHSKFGHSDDLTYRRSAPDLPQLEFWHQTDFEDVLLRLFATASSAGDGGQHAQPHAETPAKASVRGFLKSKLDRLEKVVEPWITLSAASTANTANTMD